MKYNNILENNKLIAQFMGGIITHTQEYEMPHGSHSTGIIEYWDKIKGKPIDGYEDAKVGIFGYNYSWDWLMPVVEEIENSCNRAYQFKIYRNQAFVECTVMGDNTILTSQKFVAGSDYKGENTKLANTYQAVIEFIKWYNNKNEH